MITLILSNDHHNNDNNNNDNNNTSTKFTKLTNNDPTRMMQPSWLDLAGPRDAAAAPRAGQGGQGRSINIVGVHYH